LLPAPPRPGPCAGADPRQGGRKGDRVGGAAAPRGPLARDGARVGVRHRARVRDRTRVPRQRRRAAARRARHGQGAGRGPDADGHLARALRRQLPRAGSRDAQRGDRPARRRDGAADPVVTAAGRGEAARRRAEGRVGSDADGWATFIAKKVAADAPQPAAQAFAGRWRGMVREPGPQGRELRYPVTVSFSGNADDLRAEVAADAAYPLEHGGTTPLEYRATFRGRARDGELRMQSERVQVRLVEFDRTETVPQQELSARLEGGVLRGTVTSPGQQPSHFELRSEDGDVRTADERPGEVPSAEAPPDPGNRPARPGTTAYPTLVLERREIVDPQMGGIVSHMLSVPRGWLFEGGARWTGNPDHIVDFVGELRGPDGESVVFVRDRQFRYARAHSQVGVFDETDGRTFPDGATARHAPQQPGEVAVEVLLAELRPGAGAVRLVQAERVPALEEALRALLKPQLDMIQALIDQSRRQPMP